MRSSSEFAVVLVAAQIHSRSPRFMMKWVLPQLSLSVLGHWQAGETRCLHRRWHGGLGRWLGRVSGF